MKIRYIIPLLLCIILASCGEDRRTEYLEATAQDKWLYDMMAENYYWYADMPSSRGLNYFTAVPAFFGKILSTKDTGRSYVEDITDIESRNSYGFGFDASVRYNDSAYAVRVLYVESDSPANDAGLKRGDWIIKRNDQYIIRNRIDSLYKGKNIVLTLGEYYETTDENDNPIYGFREKEDGVRNLSAARITTDNPIHHYGIYSTGSKTIGYLAYYHLKREQRENNESYNEELRSISNAFRSANLSDFILDLRYNAGGSIESAQLLGSILAPAEALGNTMCHLSFNDKTAAEKDTTLLFDNAVLGNGSNLNLNSLYIITGSATGGIPETLINSLKAYINDVIIIGQTTKGNFTGTHAYTNEDFPQYIFYPVDCMISNAKDEVPATGFTPNYTINELNYDMYPIGDINEILLYATVYFIENGSIPNME